MHNTILSKLFQSLVPTFILHGKRDFFIFNEVRKEHVVKSVERRWCLRKKFNF